MYVCDIFLVFGFWGRGDSLSCFVFPFSLFFLNLGGYVVLRRGGGGKIPCDSWIMMRSLSFSFSGSLTLNATSPIRVVYLSQTSCQTVRTNRTHTSHIHVFFQPETALQPSFLEKKNKLNRFSNRTRNLRYTHSPM